MKDRFGFSFWLGWILWFAGSFLAAGVFWTLLMQRLFGGIRGGELTFSWAVAVFGSWFLLLTPFMRKKEQIWKRLNYDEERAVDAWLVGSNLFILSLIASCLLWTWKFRAGVAEEGLSANWMKAVFGSWLLFLMPMPVLMYRKADQIMKEAVKRQQARGPRFQSVFIEKTRRMLPETLKQNLRDQPQTMPNAHIVSLEMTDGRRIEDVFVLNGREVLGLYGREINDFDASQAVALRVKPPENLPPYDEALWYRLDGRA